MSINFLKNYESDYQTYLTSNSNVPSSTEGTTDVTVNKPMSFVEFVRNELRKKNMVVFTNQDNQTILIRYKGDKEKMDWNDIQLRFSRSIIYDLETHETLMIAPCKSYLLDEFKNKHSDMSNVVVEDFPSGPMVNMYHHPRKGWQLSTRSYVGANNNFRSGDKSFHQLFDECLKNTTSLTVEEFGSNLDQTNTFSFVITHPEYFDVARYAEPCLVLVEVRDRLNDHKLVDNTPVSDYFTAKGWNIKFPKRHNITSWEAVTEFIKTQPSQEQGLVFRYDNERAKIRNQDFLVARKLLGNHSKIVDVFAENLQNKTVNEFLVYFPEKANEFHHFSTIYHDICAATHAFYIAHNTRPTNQKIEFNEIPRPIQTSVWNIHKQYLESGTSSESRRPVKPNVVDAYYRNMTSIELANILTYWDKFIKEQKDGQVTQPRRHPDAPPLKTYTPNGNRNRNNHHHKFQKKYNNTPAAETAAVTTTAAETAPTESS
jgi:hypothetical protein